jgi:hypothetical protein
MSITTEFRVSVEFPYELWEASHENRIYKHRISAAIDGFIEAGSCDNREWATFSDMASAKRCEVKLLAYIEELKESQADIHADTPIPQG